MTYSIVARCCNRLLIGKTYWKGIALSTVLFASEILEYTEEKLNKLQSRKFSL